MNKNKKSGRKFRPGKAAGVLALALALAFSLAACGGDDGGGGGGGGSLGESALGETLLIDGVQLYDYEMSIDADEDYKTYTGADVTFTVRGYEHRIGGNVEITGGKLTFTADVPVAEDLYNVKDAQEYRSLENMINGMNDLDGYDLPYTNLTIEGTEVDSAKWGELALLSNNDDSRSDRLSRYRYADEMVNEGDHNYTNITTVEDATYIYVDKAVTIKADGGTKKTESSGSDDNHYDLKSLNITLQKGWNVVYSKYTYSGVTDTDTFEMKAGDPSNVHWLNEWETK